MANLNIKKSSLYPIKNLKNKANYKLYSIIKRDGSIIERVFLDTPIPSIREKLICQHYLSQRVKIFYKEDVGFNIIYRDNPWDFKIELSTSEIFNIEITSIADDRAVFEKLKREERLKINTFKEKIPLHELVKMNSIFPNNETDKQIIKYKKAKVSKEALVNNPFYEQELMLVSNIHPKLTPLSEIIKEAIIKKEAKSHSEKESTILIIDNRTMIYELDDFQKARKELKKQTNSTPFREVWLYTGYYSSLDGNEAEYNLSPLKLTNEQYRILEKETKINPPDENNIMYM